ncbi:tripartite tricarboxylate transporter substrate binding protein [Roseomonas sp. ACRSG]|nr:tripartite tricarboxylate transporter substrate binding protein [Roseomonas sp. ACRSG]
MNNSAMSRRGFLGASLMLAAPALLPRTAHAVTWPERPVRLIVPVAPGGSQDIVARLLARHLGEALGQNLLVENLPGAGSNIGYDAAARARPDGYTLLAGSDSLSINPALFERLSFDPLKDFAPVLSGVRVPQILVVRTDAAPQDLGAFVDSARQGPVAVGTPGNGSLSHLVGELMQQATETRWTHVPYKGGALAVNDLMGGFLQGVWINIGAVTDHVRSGRLRGLAVSSASRAAVLPDVPTLEEAGLRGLVATGWHGLVAPAGLDADIVARLNAEGRKVLFHPEVAERLASLGVEPLDEAPGALAARMAEDTSRWAAVVKRAGIRAD